MSKQTHKTEGVNRTKKVRFYPSSCTGKELDPETGYSYFGSRYLDHTPLTLWLSVDPMSDKYPSISPYAYCAWNPLKLVDPDGNEISTHTDKEGNVVAVYNDGDNGVYRHNGNRAFTENELKGKYNSTYNTSAGGEWMGETAYWDEFRDHDGLGNVKDNSKGTIYFDQSWDKTIKQYNMFSRSIGLEATAILSLPR